MSLTIENLTKSFDDKPILNSFSYKFPEKGVVAIQGESGIGKTTLLRMIAGLDNDFEGKIVGGGIERVSIAFQEHRLFPELTALDNVIFAIFDRKNEAEIDIASRMLFDLGFTKEEIHLLPNELSGGMKQRVSIARALLKKSPILLLDEPTKELDKENILKILSLIKREAQNRLVIIVTHNEKDAEYLSAKKIRL